MPVDFTCSHCGRRTIVAEQYAGQSGPCAGCGQIVTVPPLTSSVHIGNLGDNAAIRMILPVGRSGYAIAAGYAGLFAVLCFPAPIALVLGILAVRDIRRHSEKHGMGRAIFGLVMGILFTILLLIMLIAMACAGIRHS